MSRDDHPSSEWSEPGVARYLTIALVSLAVIGIVVYQRTSGIVAFIPVLAGLAGALSGFGPILLVLAIAVCLNASAFAEPAFSQDLFADGLLCMAVLAYVIAFYRLQSLLVQVFPPDPRLRGDRAPRKGVLRFLPTRGQLTRQRRAADQVTTLEIGTALWTLPVWAILALYVWLALPEESGNPGLPQPVWHAVVLAWLFGLLWFVSFGFLGYVRDRLMTAEEAEVFLQDTLWAETRREQRRLNRWLTWQRRRMIRKGTP